MLHFSLLPGLSVLAQGILNNTHSRAPGIPLTALRTAQIRNCAHNLLAFVLKLRVGDEATELVGKHLRLGQ